MKGKATYVSYLLDAEGMLSLVEDRIKNAVSIAARNGDAKHADEIAELQDMLTQANITLFTILIGIDDRDLSEHLAGRTTPIGYEFREEGNDNDTVRIAKEPLDYIND